jgi:DNA-binding protein HU-beta
LTEGLSAGRVNVEDSYHLEGGQVTKSEFVDQVADRAGLSKKDAGDAVDAVLETIEDTLKRGSDISFSGFGKFSVSQRSAREGRNPATGEKIQIAASKVPKFTAGAGLKKAVKS